MSDSRDFYYSAKADECKQKHNKLNNKKHTTCVFNRQVFTLSITHGKKPIDINYMWDDVTYVGTGNTSDVTYTSY